MEELYEKLKQCQLSDTKSDDSDLDQELEQFLKWDQLDKDTQYKLISAEIEQNWHFPTEPIVNLLRQKSRLEFQLGHFRQSGLTMLQSQALSFRHQAITQYYKRIATAMKDNENDELSQMQKSLLAFQTTSESSEQIQHMVQSLPSTWRVVQITINDDQSVSRFKNTPAEKATTDNFDLKLVAIECGGGRQKTTKNVSNKNDTLDDNCVTVHEIFAVKNEDKMPSVLGELQDILSMHLLMYKSDVDKVKYKQTREEVDSRMESLLKTIEDKWLGYSKVLLLGKSENEAQIIDLCDTIHQKFFSRDTTFVTSGRKKILHKILDGHQHLFADQLSKGLKCVTEGKLIKGFLQHFENVVKFLPNVDKRHPTVFILDKEIQSLPWEALNCLKNHPLSRVPSIHTLSLLYRTHMTNTSSVSMTGVRQDKIFYVLNPDQNLAKTQARLETTFADMNLGEGIIGEQPSLPQMKQVLSDMDAFMYCGHGANLKNFPQTEIEKLNIRALPMLFGCNSGRLERMGRNLDPIGTVHYYLIATAPCLLGFLWSITDRDVDQWTVEFLQYWLNNEDQPEFVQAIAQKRSGFSRMINSAAVVIYGLPSLICQK